MFIVFFLNGKGPLPRIEHTQATISDSNADDNSTPEERLTGSHRVRAADVGALLRELLRPDAAMDPEYAAMVARWRRAAAAAAPRGQLPVAREAFVVERVARYCALPALSLVDAFPDGPVIHILGNDVQDAIETWAAPAGGEALLGALFLLTHYGNWERVRAVCLLLAAEVAAAPEWWTCAALVASPLLGRSLLPLLHRCKEQQTYAPDEADRPVFALCLQAILVNQFLPPIGPPMRSALLALVETVGNEVCTPPDGDVGWPMTLVLHILPTLLRREQFDAWARMLLGAPGPLGVRSTLALICLRRDRPLCLERLLNHLVDAAEGEDGAFGLRMGANAGVRSVLEAVMKAADTVQTPLPPPPSNPEWGVPSSKWCLMVPDALRVLVATGGEPVAAWSWVGSIHAHHLIGVSVELLGRLLGVVDQHRDPTLSLEYASLLVNCLGGGSMERGRAAPPAYA